MTATKQLEYLENNEAIAWDAAKSQWVRYRLVDGTNLEPEIARIADHFVALSWAGQQILLQESR